MVNKLEGISSCKSLNGGEQDWEIKAWMDLNADGALAIDGVIVLPQASIFLEGRSRL